MPRAITTKPLFSSQISVLSAIGRGIPFATIVVTSPRCGLGQRTYSAHLAARPSHEGSHSGGIM